MTNRRMQPRHDVNMVMPVRIVLEESGEAVSCRVEDVSPEGLGVMAQSEMKSGTRLVFETLDRSYTFEVAWCRAAGPRRFKCGLRLAETGSDLSLLFSQLIAVRDAG